jgi:hypothetical protein
MTPGAAPIRWMGPIRNPRWEQKRTEGYVIVSNMWWEMLFINSNNVYQYINIQFTEIILEAQIILYRSLLKEDLSN